MPPCPLGPVPPCPRAPVPTRLRGTVGPSTIAHMLNRSQRATVFQVEDGTCTVFAVDGERVVRAKAALLSDDVAEDVTDIFKVLAHPTRVGILRALTNEPLCVCDLAQVLDLSVSAISHQLRALRQARLVECRMDGKLAYYSIREPLLLSLLDQVIEPVAGIGA